MINAIIAAILIVAFFMCIYSFVLGFKMGKSISKGNVPELNLNPVKVYKEHVAVKEEKKEVDKYIQGWENLRNYDGEPQKPIEEKR